MSSSADVKRSRTASHSIAGVAKALFAGSLASLLALTDAGAQLATSVLSAAEGTSLRVVLGEDSSALVYLVGYDRAYRWSWKKGMRSDTLIRISNMPRVGGVIASRKGFQVLDFGTLVWDVREDSDGPTAVLARRLVRPPPDHYVAALLAGNGELVAPTVRDRGEDSSLIVARFDGRQYPLFPQQTHVGSIVVERGQDSVRVSTAAQSRWFDRSARWSVSDDGASVARANPAKRGMVAVQQWTAPAWTSRLCNVPVPALTAKGADLRSINQELLGEFRSAGTSTVVTNDEYASAIVRVLGDELRLPPVRGVMTQGDELILNILTAGEAGFYAWFSVDLRTCSVTRLAKSSARIATQSKRWRITSERIQGAYRLAVYDLRAPK